MIIQDQPKVFGSHITVGYSSVDDGDLSSRGSAQEKTRTKINRSNLLKKLGIMSDRVACIQTTYGGDHTRYKVVTSNDQDLIGTMPYDSDSLATRTSGVVLFLTLADCIGAIIYDPVHNALMIAHLGRQATEQHGASKSIEFMTASFGSRPSDLIIWMGPAAGSANYPLFSFENQSLHQVNRQHFIDASVDPAKITTSPIDTTNDTNYFSHSEFLKDRRSIDGLHAAVAMLH